MKTDLGTGYIIEGGNSYNEINRIDAIIGHKHLFLGKTSEIPENIAKKCVSELWFLTEKVGYTNNIDELEYKTAKEAIQSACNQPYCIIYKS